MSDPKHLARCEREIADALEAGQKEHTRAEQIGILLWEMDWRAERESILAEAAALGSLGMERAKPDENDAPPTKQA